MKTFLLTTHIVMGKNKFIILVLVVLIGGSFYYYHFYVKTLMLSEIVGHSDNPISNILTNIFDFDTGLTRHDLNRIKKSSNYWKSRIDQVESIDDPNIRDREMIKLMDEMTSDPSLKKVSKLIGSKGIATGLKIFEILN